MQRKAEQNYTVALSTALFGKELNVKLTGVILSQYKSQALLPVMKHS